jgi:hypothetical protein
LCLGADENPATFVFVTVLVFSRLTTHTSPVRSIIPVVSLASSPHLAPVWNRVTTNARMSGGRCGGVTCRTSQETDPRVPLVSLPPRPGCNGSIVTSRWSTSTGTSSRETPHRKTCLVRRVIALIVWRASFFLIRLRPSRGDLRSRVAGSGDPRRTWKGEAPSEPSRPIAGSPGGSPSRRVAVRGSKDSARARPGASPAGPATRPTRSPQSRDRRMVPPCCPFSYRMDAFTRSFDTASPLGVS